MKNQKPSNEAGIKMQDTVYKNTVSVSEIYNKFSKLKPQMQSNSNTILKEVKGNFSTQINWNAFQQYVNKLFKY